MRARIRRWLVLLVAAGSVGAALAIPALGAEDKELKVDPAAATSAPGFTDLDQLTYAQARDRLTQLSEITLPVAIEGLELIDVSGVTLDSNDAGRSLALSGTASLPALHGGSQDVDLLVTAIWPDDTAPAPAIAIAAKTDDLSLTEINPLWDDSYGDVRFATARLAIVNTAHEIDPADLPASAHDFYAEPVTLGRGISFAGDLELSGRLADAFGYAGYSGEIALAGSLGGSAAALFGGATDEQLDDLRLEARLAKSPTAPQWIQDRTSTFVFTLAGGNPGLSVEEDVTVALPNTTNNFHGRAAIAPSGAIEVSVDLVGGFSPPFGLDRIDLSRLRDISLRLALDNGSVEGGLAFGVAMDDQPDPVRVTADFVTHDGTTSANFAVAGRLPVPTLVAFAGQVLGTEVAEIPGAGDVSLTGVSFSFTTGAGQRIFSVGASAAIRDLEAGVVFTLRTRTNGPAQPLLGLRLSDPQCDPDCIRMSALLPPDLAGDTLAGLRLPALNLTVAPDSLSELAAADLTPQEQAFFGDAYDTLPDTLHFEAGVNLQGRLPVDALGDDVRTALGFPAGDDVVLNGTLGAGVTLSRLKGGSGFTLNELELTAELPAATNSTILPDWVDPSGPTTLAFRYQQGSIALSFAAAADVEIDDTRFATTIEGRLGRAGRRTSIEFGGTIDDWQQPFGVSWIDELEHATLEIDTSFGDNRPADVNAAVTAAVVLGGKRFELEFALSKAVSTSATLTARFADTATLGEIADLFPELQQAAGDLAGKPQLDALSIGPVSVGLKLGGGATAFELTARTQFRNLTSDLLIAARTGGAFTLGIKPRGSVRLDQLVTDAPALEIRMPSAALVLGSQEGTRPVRELTDGEFDFYKSLYDCTEEAERADCADFRRLELTRGLKLLAAFDMGDDVDEMAGAIGIQTSGNALLAGSIPVFGGTDFSLSASLGNFRFDNQPDWYERGDVELEIGTDGLRFVGALDVKIQREGDEWMPTCVDGEVRQTYVDGRPVDRCYDILSFRVSARATLQPPSFTLTGLLATDKPWRHAFGQDWLEINGAALQLGVTLAGGLPEVTMGFRGDVKIGEKDIAAALKVGLAPLPGPPFVRPNLIGFSAASTAGVGLRDVLWLNEQITGTALPAPSSLPEVSLRNLFLQYSQQTDVDLCLTQGVRFNADVYVGGNAPGDPPRDLNGCRTVDTNPETRQSCKDAQGCLASVYGSIDSGGLRAGGELTAFDLGPIAFEDSLVELALTPELQRLRLRGGARIATPDYEFAAGRADLELSREQLRFSGDARLFGDEAFHAYLEAAAAFDLSDPSFRVRAWLRADARGAMDDLVGARAENVRPVIVALGSLLRLMTGDGSVQNVRELPARLERAGIAVPSDVRKMLDVLGEAQSKIQQYDRPALTFDALLRGFSFDVAGVPGWWAPRACVGVVIAGTCYGFWSERTCVTTLVHGTCYTTPPFTVRFGGICDALGIPSSDCSWAGLMRRYVQTPLLAALERATGLDFDAANFEDALTTLVDRFADGVGSIVTIDCAYFEADGRELARGNVSVSLATKLRLFGHRVEFGANWDFRAEGGSPGEVLDGIFRTLFESSSETCPDIPAGHEQPREDIPNRRLTATLTPTELDEGGEVTLTGTFDEAASAYPAVQVNWGDGATTTIPAGAARTVSATHRYLNDGPAGLPQTRYGITAVVQDPGAHTQQIVATVRNVAPTVTALSAQPAPSDEHGVITVRAAFTDPGTADRHEVTIDWGDGSEPETHRLNAGARAFAITHRYLDDPAAGDAYTVTAEVSDDDTGAATRGAAAHVRNVAPSGIRVTPLGVIAGDPAPTDDADVAEGAVVNYGIDFDDPGTLDAHTIIVDWGDGGETQTLAVGAGTRRIELPHQFLDDGAFDVSVRVGDDDGGEGTGTSAVRAGNVAPRVSAALDQESLAEGESARVEGAITDPSPLDRHTLVIDWGEGRTDADRYERVAVADNRTFAARKPYGDDGRFTIAAVATDDDGGEGRAELALAVANAAPAVAIEDGGSVQAPGGRSFIARAGRALELRARARDAGSDDLAVSWTWRDGTTTVTDHLAAPPDADPDPSPQLAPRDLVDAQAHTWAQPCLYEDVAVGVADDDGGTAGDAVDVVVTGTADDDQGPGYWKRQYDPGKQPHIAEATLACYLRIVDQMSAVFGEVRPVAAGADAYAVLDPDEHDERAKLDRALLTAWLNFAHGALGHGAIADAMSAAEQVRLDPGATMAQLQAARARVSVLVVG